VGISDFVDPGFFCVGGALHESSESPSAYIPILIALHPAAFTPDLQPRSYFQYFDSSLLPNFRPVPECGWNCPHCLNTKSGEVLELKGGAPH